MLHCPCSINIYVNQSQCDDRAISHHSQGEISHTFIARCTCIERVIAVITDPKHEGVHFLLDVLVCQLVTILIRGFQEHVKKCSSLPHALV